MLESKDETQGGEQLVALQKENEALKNENAALKEQVKKFKSEVETCYLSALLLCSDYYYVLGD